MSDPQFALILIPTFLAAVAAASWLKTLDTAFVREARVPLVAGVVAGVLLRLAGRFDVPHALLTGVVLTAAALYVRLTGRESEPSDGMLLGAVSGAAVGAFLLSGQRPLLRLSECLLTGAVAGYGITLGVTSARNRVRQLALDALTGIVAVAAAAAPRLLVQGRVTDRSVAMACAALVPFLAAAAVLRQWPAVRAELHEEASLGFIEPGDARTTAHPLLRLGRGGWHDAAAHREFVRIATRIALRKRQQRVHPEPVARLYQLEVIKLRMEMREMTRIDRAMRAGTVQEETA